MIYDKLSNCKQYKGLSVYLDKALDILASTDFSKLTAGRYDVDGDNVFYMLQQYQSGEVMDKIEAHRKYIDLQFVVSGTERIGIDIKSRLSETVSPYSEQKDVEFFAPEPTISFVNMQAGDFMILWPSDAHMPGRSIAQPQDVVKVVFKIKA